MQAGEFYNIFNTKINITCKSGLKIFVSSRPVNAGCSFIETSQIENKYDYDRVIWRYAVTSVYLNFGIHFDTPLVLEPGANVSPPPVTPLLGRTVHGFQK
jgi:hypothetical protein